MITLTQYKIPKTLITEALTEIPHFDFRFTINEPAGDFFYDPWKLKSEFQNTIWQKLYDSLPVNKGEARIIKLEAGTCYASHADADDRYHLNLSGNKCYMIDLDSKEFYPLIADGSWYEMDAGRRHTAANFGNKFRYQLVVRKLLVRSALKNLINITFKIKELVDLEDARFIFDDVISPWISKVNKQGQMNDFKFQNGIVSFSIDPSLKQELEKLIPVEFELIQ